MINLPAAAVSLTIRDISGSLAYMKLSVGGNTEIATVRSALIVLIERLSNVMRGTVTDYKIIYETIVDGEAQTNSRVEHRAALVFNAGLDMYAVLELPAIPLELVKEDNTIDIENAAMADFIAAISDGIFCNPFGNDIVDLEAAIYEYKP